MQNIKSREEAKVQAWGEFYDKNTSIVDTPTNWSEMSPRQKQMVIKHRKNMQSIC